MYLEVINMPKKNKNEGKTACACGSTAFIQEGLANYKDGITISAKGVLEGGCPELDIITSTIKCAQCGAEYDP